MFEIECRLTQNLPAGHVLLPEALEHPVLHSDWIGKTLARNVVAGSILSADDVLPIHDNELRPLDELDVMDQLVALDRRIFDELGTAYANEPWTVANFEYPLPGKSEVSFVVVSRATVLGFWIGSESVAGEAHTHRVAVESSWRSRGMSYRLFCAFWCAAIVRQSVWRMTVEIGADNVRARRFYNGLGYRLASPQETKAYLEARGRDQVTDGVEIIEASGARSVVMGRPIERGNWQ
jgi:ribosomal protein S18 acetylase RimI-like enzyme